MVSWQSALIIVLWTSPSITAILLIPRICLQSLRPKSFHRPRQAVVNPAFEKWSSAMMLFAMATSLVNTAFCLDSAHHGLGKSASNIDSRSMFRTMRSLFLSQAFGTAGATSARVSVALYELFLFPGIRTQLVAIPSHPSGIIPATRRWFQRLAGHEMFLWLTVAVQAVLNISCIIQVCLQCRPVSRWWNPNIPGKCTSSHVHVTLGYFQGAINTMTALALSLLPCFMVKDLQAPWKKKLGVVALLGMGIVDAGICLTKTALLERLSSSDDLPYDLAPLVVAWTLEQYIAVNAGSAPYIAQLIRKRNHPIEERRQSFNMRFLSGRQRKLSHPNATHTPIIVEEDFEDENQNANIANVELGLRDRRSRSRNGRGNSMEIRNDSRGEGTSRRRGHKRSESDTGGAGASGIAL